MSYYVLMIAHNGMAARQTRDLGIFIGAFDWT